VSGAPTGRRRLPPLLGASIGLHAAALGALALRPGAWRAVVALLVADHALLAGAGLWPRSRLLGPNLNRLPADRAAAGEVALTFDDGPDPEVTPGVLELLAAAGARASFFCIGERAAARPELVAEIVRRGHRVENHSHRHSHWFSLLGPRAAAREVDRAQAALAAAAGRPPVWFRAPAGLRSPWFGLLLARRGLALASWTRRGFDTVDRDPGRVSRRLLAGLGAGDVLLLHDGGAARTAGGRPVVLEALPRVLETLAGRGLAAVPLPDPQSHPRGTAALAGVGGPAVESRRPSPRSSSR
jgi:peptidoglycan/xylan/chitin deacetylase (PgdA/CDA1 family)